MKTKIFSCMSLVFLLMLSSCLQNDEVFQETRNLGKFFATPISDFSFDVTTRVVDGNKKLRLSNTDFSEVEVSEELWNSHVASTTRVSGEDVSWTNEPLLSMYIADANNADALLVGNVPLNPTSLAVYDKYDVNKAGTPSAITGSSFFWDTWEKRNYLQDKTVNFYGYYPRPCDEINWEYRRNSIIEKEFATNVGKEWNKLDYTFYQDQTDANLSYFDLMYSIPEEANAADSHRHGNKNKNKNSNIQMAFKHAFCLLNIDIFRGKTYEGDCKITSLSLKGTQVFTGGTLDLVAGKITPSKPDVLNRTIDATAISGQAPFHTTMIVQPTTSSPSGTDTDASRIVLTCTIDGAEYSCSLPELELEGGKKYNLKLTVTPSGTSVFRVWHGATVNVGNETITSCEKKLSAKSEYFTVSHQGGYRILRVLKNGQIITPNEDGQYKMDQKEGANTYYNIVACPEDNWYEGQEKLRILFDAKWNNMYHAEDSQDTDILYWSDLTGNGNDGTLQSFNNDNGVSGWGDNCLYFDGIDDIVRYPGNISSGDFTVEVYIYVYAKQVAGKVYGRLFAEDERTGYPSLCYKTDKDATYGNLSICGNRIIDHQLPNETNLFGRLVQIDYVYDSINKELIIYMDGKEVRKASGVSASTSIAEASLGNRISDNTRALKCKYYNFLLYDKMLTVDNMKTNLSVNTRRFGAPFQKAE